MAATITDYFNKASNMNGSYPPVATVSAARLVGATTLSCDDLTGWATDTPVHFSTFQLAADGTVDTSTQTDWKGIVSGNTITNMTRLAGAADSGNTSGDKVELNPTIGWLDDLITGLLVSHKQDGKLKDSIVKPANVDWDSDWTSYSDEFTPLVANAAASITWVNNVTRTTSGSFNFQLRKTGHVVFIGGKINIGATFNSYTTLFTLPSGYRPVTDVSFAVGDNIFDVRYNGTVQCHSKLESGAAPVLSATWVTV